MNVEVLDIVEILIQLHVPRLSNSLTSIGRWATCCCCRHRSDFHSSTSERSPFFLSVHVGGQERRVREDVGVWDHEQDVNGDDTTRGRESSDGSVDLLGSFLLTLPSGELACCSQQQRETSQTHSLGK